VIGWFSEMGDDDWLDADVALMWQLLAIFGKRSWSKSDKQQILPKISDTVLAPNGLPSNLFLQSWLFAHTVQRIQHENQDFGKVQICMRVSQRHQAAAQAAAASASWPALAGQRRLKHLISSEMLVITNLAFFPAHPGPDF
jgi:hypothetical protein